MTNKITNAFSLVLFFLLLSNIGYAQKKKKDLIIEERFWGKTAPEYLETTHKEAWNNESAVILYAETEYVYDKIGRKMSAISTYHTRVKLLDKAAITDYSEFSFSKKFRDVTGKTTIKGETKFGIKIIKEDGTEKVVDLATAVPTKGDEDPKNDRKKIAIPDLQEGDIVDYYYWVEEKFPIGKSHFFDPSLSTLSGTYPIGYQKIEFKVEQGFYINFKSLNDAPNLEKKQRKQRKIYSIEMQDVPRVDDVPWFYQYRVLPTIKFQVAYAENETVKDPFLGSENEEKTQINPKEIAETLTIDYWGFKKLGDELSKEFFDLQVEKGYTTKEEVVKGAYRYFYHKYIGKNLEGMYLGELDPPGVNQLAFVSVFAMYLNDNDFDFDYIVTVPRHVGRIQDMVLKDEMGIMIRVNLPEPLYFSNFDLHPRTGLIPNGYEGAEAMVFSPPTGHSEVDLYGIYSMKQLLKRKDLICIYDETITLPISSKANNNTKYTKKVRFDSTDMTKLIFDNKYQLTGHNKDYFQEKVLQIYDYNDVEKDLWGTKSFINSPEFTKTKVTALKQKKKDLITELAEIRENNLKDVLKNDYKKEEVEIIDFNLLNMGRFEAPKLTFSTSFSIEGMVKKAGPNYILEAGNLIGSQVEVEEKHLERTVDIFIDNRKSFNYQIEVSIPENYTVEGLENLQKSVSNETGGFESTAKIDGNILNITVKKWYNENFLPTTKWSDMIAFLQAANQFTQEKVLLKKK